MLTSSGAIASLARRAPLIVNKVTKNDDDNDGGDDKELHNIRKIKECESALSLWVFLTTNPEKSFLHFILDISGFLYSRGQCVVDHVVGRVQLDGC